MRNRTIQGNLPRLSIGLPLIASLVLAFSGDCAQGEKVVYDEDKQGDLGQVESNDDEATVSVAGEGVYVLKGAGQDAVDDVDAFLFEVTGKLPFDFCLVADAAEFKWLRAIDAQGKQKDVAFGSTNFSFKAPRNIMVNDLPPGRYRVDMAFGPDGASGEWVAKIAPRPKDKSRSGPLCAQAVDPTTAEKMKAIDWPGIGGRSRIESCDSRDSSPGTASLSSAAAVRESTGPGRIAGPAEKLYGRSGRVIGADCTAGPDRFPGRPSPPFATILRRR